jgi:hypothetical protein
MPTTGVHSRNDLNKKVEQAKYQSGLGEVQMARCIYDYAVDGGAIAEITPKQNCLLPNNAVIIGGTINSTTAVTSAGGANITIGTSAGSAADSILGSTAKGSLTLDALIDAVPVLATPVKLTDKGRVTVTPDAVLTAGVIEIVLYYITSQD